VWVVVVIGGVDMLDGVIEKRERADGAQLWV